jgi:hypothetical protein
MKQTAMQHQMMILKLPGILDFWLAESKWIQINDDCAVWCCWPMALRSKQEAVSQGS